MVVTITSGIYHDVASPCVHRIGAEQATVSALYSEKIGETNCRTPTRAKTANRPIRSIQYIYDNALGLLGCIS
jgi:hypothetical protein